MNSIVQKPWGSYLVLEQGKNYLVKNIFIKPGEKLSLQSHEHRSEHWTIVEGFAKITINSTINNLKSNDSIFIPKNAKHRVENNNNENLIIIEIQYGNILQEDDIIRYEDIYGRK
jgi:mannose-6-phosphate isomerase-like protein (cupin superfamily)